MSEGKLVGDGGYVNKSGMPVPKSTGEQRSGAAPVVGREGQSERLADGATIAGPAAGPIDLPSMEHGDGRSWSPAEAEIMRFFAWGHLPAPLQVISRPFYVLAAQIINRTSGPSAELQAGLRKLLEAKDCMVRACLPR